MLLASANGALCSSVGRAPPCKEKVAGSNPALEPKGADGKRDFESAFHSDGRLAKANRIVCVKSGGMFDALFSIIKASDLFLIIPPKPTPWISLSHLSIPSMVMKN